MDDRLPQAVVIVTLQKKTTAGRRPFSLPGDAGSVVTLALAVSLAVSLAFAFAAMAVVLARLLLMRLCPLAVSLQTLLVRLDLPLVPANFPAARAQPVFRRLDLRWVA